MNAILLVWANNYDEEPLGAYGSLDRLREDYPTAMNGDFIEDCCNPEFIYYYVDFYQ